MFLTTPLTMVSACSSRAPREPTRVGRSQISLQVSFFTSWKGSSRPLTTTEMISGA